MKFDIYKISLLTIVTFCFSSMLHLASAQINVKDLYFGNYEYTSDLPDASLHFYLFDDGYHSFEKDNIHQYSIDNANGNPIAYTTDPYGTDEPEETAIGGGQQGSSSPAIDKYEMNNKVQIKRSWNLVENMENYYILMFENIESQEPISGCVEFHYNDEDQTINYADVLDQYNNWVIYDDIEDSDYENFGYTHKFVWQFKDLMPNEQRFIYLKGTCDQPSFSLVKNCAVMKTDCSDAAPPYNDENGGNGNGMSEFYELISKVSNFPHDPNCIVPSCVPDNSLTDPFGHGNLSINYRIYFQNDGIDPVENVRIESRIDSEIKSVKLHQASHRCYIIWNSNEIETKFDQIYLPGSSDPHPSHTYEETIGWVDLTVCFAEDVRDDFYYDNHCIYHNAAIHFDSLAPVITDDTYCLNNLNYCWTTYDPHAIPDNYGCKKQSNFQQYAHVEQRALKGIQDIGAGAYDVKIYPNPAFGTLNVMVPEIHKFTTMEFYNITGEKFILKQIQSDTSTAQFDISGLSAGIYVIMLTGESGLQTKTFIKQ